MRHHTTAACLLAAGITLAGCSSSGSSTDAKPATTSASPAPTVAPRDRFLQEINAANIESWATDSPPDDELAALPDQWCTQLAHGHSVNWIFDNSQGNLYPIGDTWGTEIHDAYKVLVMAVKDFCPRFTDQVTAEARAAGNY